MQKANQRKKEVEGMKIQIFSVALDGDGRSILEEDFSRDYDGSDRLDTPAKIVAVMEEVFHLSDRAEEYMYLICMNAGCKPICLFEVSHGTHDSTMVGIREIFVRAMLCGASDIVVVHNHPGGTEEPTKKDLRVTERIKEASDLLGILFCDHIIISRDSYFSFRENGKIGKSELSPDGLGSSFPVARTGN